MEEPAATLPATSPIAGPESCQGSAFHPAERPTWRAGIVYGGWALLTLIAHASGIAPLPPAAGVLLGCVAALAAGILVVVARQGVEETREGASYAVLEPLLGIACSSLYLWYAGGSPPGAVLGTGMLLSVVALALPGASLPMLGRLMAAVGLASVITPVARQLATPGAGGLTGRDLLLTELPSLALILLLGTLYLAARIMARERHRLYAENAELRAGIERIARQAERDHLTDSYNRHSILEMVAREKARADRSGESLCICLLDIDHFKELNDRYGHQAGDRILADFARRVRGALRTMDTLNTGGLPVAVGTELVEVDAAATGRSAFGRVGGEEFIVLLPETSMRGALRCAERIRRSVVRRPFEDVHQVTVSIGIAEYRPGETVSNLFGRADQALYGAKHAGRNRVHCATADGGASAIIMPDLAPFSRKGTGP